MIAVPHSEEAEFGVLGSMLWDAARVCDLCVSRKVSSAMFYVPAHRILYDAMMSLYGNNRPVDLISVTDHLKSCGELDSAGGENYIERLLSKTPTDSHAEYYIQIVQDKALRREIIDKARHMISECADSDDQAEKLRAKYEFEFAKMEVTGDRMPTLGELMDRQIARWVEAQSHKCAGIATGFKIFDLYFGGLMDSAFYIISGPQASGKTTLMRNVAENIAMRGIPVAFLTLEQTGEQIAGAIPARHAKQSVFLLNLGSSRASVSSVMESKKVAEKWPMYIDDRPKTLTQLYSWARRMITRHGCKVLFIDYLQSLRAEKKYDGDTAKVTDYSIAIRDMAKELKTPIVCISSLSRSGELRNSGQLDYDAWAHIKIQKGDAWTPKNLVYRVSFEKNRYGPPALDEHLYLIGDEQRFDEAKPE